MIRQSFVCHESHRMIFENDKFLQGFQGPVNTHLSIEYNLYHVGVEDLRF